MFSLLQDVDAFLGFVIRGKIKGMIDGSLLPKEMEVLTSKVA